MPKDTISHTPRRVTAWRVASQVLLATCLSACARQAVPVQHPPGGSRAPVAASDLQPTETVVPSPFKGCDNGGPFPVNPDRLTLSHPVDYLAIRILKAELGVGDPNQWLRYDANVLGERGTRCATATSDACKTKVLAHPTGAVNVQCTSVCAEISIVTTSGDEVKRWATLSELVALLAPIDSEDEAMMLTQAAGYTVMCGDGLSRAEVAGDGYDVHATRGSNVPGYPALTQHVLHVSRAGTVQELLDGAPRRP